jgi:hypothetical protein
MKISNMDDTLDTRDILERIKELESDKDSLEEEETKELKILSDLIEEIDSMCGEQSSDGVFLISDYYWAEYVEEMVQDIGDLPHGIPHYIVIDWEATADNVKVDYDEIDFDGQTFLYRI